MRPTTNFVSVKRYCNWETSFRKDFDTEAFYNLMNIYDGCKARQSVLGEYRGRIGLAVRGKEDYINNCFEFLSRNGRIYLVSCSDSKGRVPKDIRDLFLMSGIPCDTVVPSPIADVAIVFELSKININNE
jgi:hypothetical protein